MSSTTQWIQKKVPRLHLKTSESIENIEKGFPKVYFYYFLQYTVDFTSIKPSVKQVYGA